MAISQWALVDHVDDVCDSLIQSSVITLVLALSPPLVASFQLFGTSREKQKYLVSVHEVKRYVISWLKMATKLIILYNNNIMYILAVL